MAASSGKRTGVALAGICVLVLALVVGGWAILRWASNLSSAGPPSPNARCQAMVNSATAALSLEQSRNASIIAGVASGRGLIPRAVSIALATAFQESGIRNLDYGDRDSIGIFQQRPSQGWGTVDQIMDPYYSTGKFYDVMVTVSDWQSADIGDVAQEVQRSGFPDAYDKHVADARLLASALSGETPAAWSCVVHDPAAPDPDQLLAALSQAYGATLVAQSQPASEAGPASITLQAPEPTTAWSAAAFAQSWATQTGVTRVAVGQSTWQASPTVLAGWTNDPTETRSATTVVIWF